MSAWGRAGGAPHDVGAERTGDFAWRVEPERDSTIVRVSMPELVARRPSSPACVGRPRAGRGEIRSFR